jgi:hypothetical protein
MVGWLKRVIVGLQPPPRDATCDPLYYRQLLDLSWPSDRFPLTRFEREVPGEARAIAQVVGIVRESVISTYCQSKDADLSAKAMRAQHAKHHGCVEARFVVHKDLDPEYAIGVFDPGKSYKCVVRFSNAMGSYQSDKKLDGHGMAVKLTDVPGPSLLSTMLPEGGKVSEQDFLISGYPVFFCRDADDYTAFMTMLSLPRNTRIERIYKGIKFVLFFVWRPLSFVAFARTALGRISSPLQADYHSMTAYQLGSDLVVRYVLSPIGAPRPGVERDILGENYLHDALVAALDPSKTSNSDPIAFDFSVQIRRNAKPEDVENARRTWTSPPPEKVSLGRIEIPVQPIDGPRRMCVCQDLSFNPWNCLGEHRPLGSLNRMRLAVYMASAQVRHRLNCVGSATIAPRS